MTVSASKGADGKDVAYLYNYDGSGTQGDDLYFNVDLDGNTYTFTVESYLCGKDTDVYKAVENTFTGTMVLTHTLQTLQWSKWFKVLWLMLKYFFWAYEWNLMCELCTMWNILEKRK